MALFRDFPWKKVAGYWAAQLLGCFLGGAILYGIYSPVYNFFIDQGGDPITVLLTQPTNLNSKIGSTLASAFFSGNSSWYNL